MPSLELEFHDALNCRWVRGCTREDGPHKGEGPPDGMVDTLAATKINYVKAKEPIGVVRFEQRGTRIRTVVLIHTHTHRTESR